MVNRRDEEEGTQACESRTETEKGKARSAAVEVK